MSTDTPFRVIIAGGGIGALEAALALQELAPDRVSTTLLSPAKEFVYRPYTVAEPFSYPAAKRFPVARIARDAGAELVADQLTRVDAERKVVHTGGGQELPYDALLLALGARPYDRFEHAANVDDSRMEKVLHGLVQDIEGGYVHKVAFVSSSAEGWPLPLYELALMSARRAWESQADLSVTLITPEGAPLEAFGEEASRKLSDLLADAKVDFVSSARVEVPHSRVVAIDGGNHRLDVDRVVAMPELRGPAVRGIPAGNHGFIPVDDHMRVRGASGIWAAGDAIEYPIKHGGIGSQEADIAAQGIAAEAGANVEPEPLRPVLRGMLLTGQKPLYLNARIVGGSPVESQVSEEPSWEPATKVSARYLSPYLHNLESE